MELYMQLMTRMMTFLTEFLIAGMLSTSFCIEWSFQKWNGFSTLTNNSSPLYVESKEQIITCCGVCASIPECTSVVLNNAHCSCRSELIPHPSEVDSNTSVYVKRPKFCSTPGYIFINNMCIKVSTDKNTWHEAKLDCESTGGNLIILDSLEKHQRVFDMLSQYFDNTYDTVIKYFVGASDIEQEGSWKWIKKNSSSYMHNASLNDIDKNYVGQSADCGALNFNKNQIVDQFCDWPTYFICEVMFNKDFE